MRVFRVLGMLGVMAVAGCGAQESSPGGPGASSRSRHPERRGLALLPLDLHGSKAPPGPGLDVRRSLAVTDEAILAGFSFEEVMNQLAAQSGIPGLTGLRLYQEWWDSQRRAPGLGGGGPHCDDELLPEGGSGLNGFPYACPRGEGAQALENPFLSAATNPAAYVPVALLNRFDLAARDGSDCGEYRLVFARRSGLTQPTSRNLVSFESVLPNPFPERGLKGCREVVLFWAGLTEQPDVAARAEALRHFYFEGLGAFSPVIHVDNLGLRASGVTGQVRTNQFMQALWTLREFRLRRHCTGGTCAVRIEPDTVKTHAPGVLFSSKKEHPLKEEFAALLASQVPALAGGDLLHLSLELEERFNSGQSRSSGTEDLYVYHFGKGASPLRVQLQQQLAAVGSPLTPDQIVARAQTLSCAGCHQLSTGVKLGGGLTWPSKSTGFEFVHVSERVREQGPDGPRYGLSEVVVGLFLPHRLRLMEAYLAGAPPFDG